MVCCSADPENFTKLPDITWTQGSEDEIKMVKAGWTDLYDQTVGLLNKAFQRDDKRGVNTESTKITKLGQLALFWLTLALPSKAAKRTVMEHVLTGDVLTVKFLGFKSKTMMELWFLPWGMAVGEQWQASQQEVRGQSTQIQKNQSKQAQTKNNMNKMNKA